MTVELRPLGIKCNIQCQYCYQNPQRDAGNIPHSYDMEKMKEAIEREGGSFSLFGGEALLVPESDLEKLWSWGFQKYGYNGIQTNGTLINDNHIRMFKQYKVSVGISIDGPGELNDVRWVGTLERTREATAKVETVIEKLCQEGIPSSLIVTLHRCNATKDKLPIMHDWFRYLESIGITSARLHILEVENQSIQDKYILSIEENIEAFLSFAKLEQDLTGLKFDVFKDLRNLLIGEDNNTTCIWNACDPYTTRAVRGVEGNGQSSNCGRTNKDGIDFTKSNTEGFERYLALYHTPQEYGGCKGCRFFLMCKGECPGTAIDGDWRNRTQDCEVWKSLYRHLEEETILQGLIPISIRSDRKQLEKIFLDTWAKGQNINIASALQRLSQGKSNSASNSAHGDHTDYGVEKQNQVQNRPQTYSVYSSYNFLKFLCILKKRTDGSFEHYHSIDGKYWRDKKEFITAHGFNSWKHLYDAGPETLEGFVACQMRPPARLLTNQHGETLYADAKYDAPFEQWIFSFSYHLPACPLPDWVCVSEVKAECIRLLPKWAEHHLIYRGKGKCEQGMAVVAMGDSVITQNGGDVWAFGSSMVFQEWDSDSRTFLNDLSTGFICGGGSAYDRSRVELFHTGQVEAHGSATVVLWPSSEGSLGKFVPYGTKVRIFQMKSRSLTSSEQQVPKEDLIAMPFEPNPETFAQECQGANMPFNCAVD